MSRYQNVSILDITGAKNDGGGGDNWSYQHPTFHRPDDLPVAQPTVSEH